MNRIVLVGNGFDLAHNLPTKYEDFINWYWGERIKGLTNEASNISKDLLCTLKLKGDFCDTTWGHFISNNNVFFSKKNKDIIEYFIKNNMNFEINKTHLFGDICKSIETKGWVDIENEYYNFLLSFLRDPKDKDPKALNDELDFIKDNLIEYLTDIQNKDIKEDILNEDIRNKILEPFNKNDISVDAKQMFDNFEMLRKVDDHSYLLLDYYGSNYKEKVHSANIRNKLLPDGIMLLNFNYTKTADMYLPKNVRFKVNHIHGNLENPKSVIFGYGDELDENYKELSRLNDNEYLRNIKSIKYLESSNYRDVLSFIESGQYQIYIMGHSCGNSDRTLLNTLFEHNNCVSIKPFYYKSPNGKDNYLDIIQNISRNFTDMKLMRDRVVNKTYCEPLPQKQANVQEV